MFPIILHTSNFHVKTFLTDPTTRALKTAGIVRLYIVEVVPGGTYKVYNWGGGAFIDPGPPIPFDRDGCGHIVAGGSLDTGIWENTTPIWISAFTVGNEYIFIFEDNDLTQWHAYHVQWGSVFGDQATQTQVNKIDQSALVAAPHASSLYGQLTGRQLGVIMSDDGTNLHTSFYLIQNGLQMTKVLNPALADVELWNRRTNLMIHDFGDFLTAAANDDGLWSVSIAMPGGFVVGDPHYVKASCMFGAYGPYSLTAPVVRIST